MTYVLVAVMTLIGSSGAYFFKMSADKMGGIMDLVRMPTVYLGGTLYAVSAVLNVILLRYMAYTILYPMTAFTYVWSLLISWRFLGEEITVRRAIGIVLILIGVVLLVR